jgi:hypothetical protein
MLPGQGSRRRRSVEGQVRGKFLIVAVMLPLAACGWFGQKKDETATAPSGPTISSDDVLKRDCADDKWKQQNLGLWYSVCRQPMKW